MSLPVTSTLHVSVASGVGAESSGGASLTLNADERRLFCTHSVASLKQLAEDKRNASDDKKEELRQLVGSVTLIHTHQCVAVSVVCLRRCSLVSLCCVLCPQHAAFATAY